MIKEQLENNENVKPNTKLLNLLKENFPDFFDKDNNFKIDKFKNALKSDEINITKEGYELNFLGKSYARFQTSTETETIISPITDHNNEDENKNSENLYIIGDNLDALKHLLKSYSRKVKCIYIDPPYNTGSDGFVYPDNFKFDSATLSNKMGIDAEEAERIIDMRGKSTHSAWLTFMYPRLILARELLTDEGIIFISIDDNEQSNLKIVCDEIFGEENFAGKITVVNNPRGRDYGGIANMHEYLLVYKKSYNTVIKNLIDYDKIFPYTDEISGFELRELRNRNIAFNKDNRPNLYYPFYINPQSELDNGLLKISLTPFNGAIELFPKKSQGISTVWRWGKEKSLENININIAAKKMVDGGYMIVEKYRKNETMARSVWNGKEDNSEKGTLLVKELFNGNKVFDFPKSTDMIKKIFEIGSCPNDIILDFFSGSATTAHAVMKLNAEDGGNRKYILVQLPEEIEESKPAFKAGFKTIDEIGRERIKRAAQKIKEETNADIDYGFKVVKLENVQEDTLDRLELFDPNVLVSDDYVNDFSNEDSSGLETILTTWLNQDGYGLHAKWQDFKLVNYIAHRYSNSLYIVNEGIESSDISRLIEMIENNELNISRIVIYTYSLPFTIINELKTNIKNLRNNKTVDIIERY